MCDFLKKIEGELFVNAFYTMRWIVVTAIESW